ncbi:MAG: DNA topoisomerase IV subunit A [Spirochaetes bacterium]|nr:DNA topoisomerase IV subunit A [Spirochaetota bacterium]
MSNINHLISHNFIEYASYVIKDRAIPDIDDGLKPVQRRIFHSLNEMDDGKFHKVANVVGNTMKYHPHGDASIFSSLVVLANKEYFIDKQGNFGNIFTGDEASAARYIECRLSKLANDVLFNRDLTEFSDSYDGRNKEPVMLPAKLPVLLLLGAEGIAVGMSTKILPHNLKELLEAQIAILQKKPFEIYPDFPQAGMIDVADYQKGNGRVRIRANVKIKDEKTIIINQIPFGTTTESLISSIENAARRNKIKINAINDYTSEQVEIEVKPSRGEYAKDLINSLYAFTDCEISVNVNLITLVNNKPRQMDVDEVLKYNTKKLVADLKRELEIAQEKLTQRLHDMTLEMIFIENRIYKKIEEIKQYPAILSTIKKELNKFKKLFIRELTNDDIERLLEIRIKRISRYDIDKHQKDKDDIVRQLEGIKSNLKNMKAFTIKYLKEKIKLYGNLYPRKTKIIKMETIATHKIKHPDVKVGWDIKGGFLGTDVKGDETFTVQPTQKFIVFQKKGIFKIVSIESKTFVDTDVLVLKPYSEKDTFSVIYTDLDSKISYVKKFQVKRFLTNKEYPISPFKNQLVNFAIDNPNIRVMIHYKRKPRQKVNSEVFLFKELDIKSHSVKGNKLSTKEVQKVEKK